MDEVIECKACSGRQLVLIGSLGNTVWFRCRQCGWESGYSTETVSIELGEEVEA